MDVIQELRDEAKIPKDNLGYPSKSQVAQMLAAYKQDGELGIARVLEQLKPKGQPAAAAQPEQTTVQMTEPPQ
jgi:hypothetical protein